MKTTKDIEREVMGVHNLFWESYANRDIELRFSLCSEDVTFIGSGLHERALNKTEYKNINVEGVKQFPDPFQIEFLWTNLTMLNEEVVCVESEVVWSQLINNEVAKELLRNTTIIKYNNNKWLVTHVHGSVPDYRLKVGDYMTNEQTIIRHKELERQVFERTQDLNKTLEELEQKNRELEIETALEKVRSSALAIKEPTDMVEVCRIISDQLQLLGVRNIRNVQTAIIHEQKSTYLNYQYFAAYNKSVIEEAEYNKHPKAREMAKTMKKSVNAFFSQSFDGEELNVFREYRKQDNQFPDPLLEESFSLHFYFYSIGPGALGISTYNSTLSESDMGLFKRFRNVFELAYRRFTDIDLAIAQAREARIEAALEKIRSRALAMHNSSEVGNVSTLLFLELEKMDINPRGFSIMIFDEEQDKYELWRAKEVEHQGAYETFSIKAMYDKFDQYVPGFGEELKSAWTKGNPFFVVEFREEKRVSFLQANREMANYSDEVFEKMKKGWPDPTFWHLVFFKYGWFGVLQNEQLIKEDLLLIHRFAVVFDFAYTRFLDLQKAEAQAREAKIETALERVRSRTMGMQKSEELKDVIQVVYEQFVHLKINVDHAGFVVDYTSKGDWHFWIADERDIPSKITHPYFESVWSNQFDEAKAKGADFFATNLNFEEKNKFYNELLSYVSGLPEASKDFYLSCPGLAASTVLLENVGLYIENFSGIPYKDEENNTLMRFGKVFQQTYTRFLDLQKAEAQARDAQIETAVERVRAQSMAMYKTSDLYKVNEEVLNQLHKLKVDGLTGVSIYLVDENEVVKVWDLSNPGNMGNPNSYSIKYDSKKYPVLGEWVKIWKSSNQDYFVLDYPREKLLEAVEEFKEIHSDIAVNFINALESGKLQHQWNPSGRLSDGMLAIDLMKPPTEDTKSIVTKMAGAFNLAYQRFLDLQKAEAQARDAEIELSLERVRSKAMAMHSPNDLSETVNVFFKELKTLGIIPIRCGVGQIDETTRSTSLTTTTSSQQGDSFQVIGKVKQTGHPVLDGIFDHWKLQKEYHPVLEGEDIKAYYNVMNAQIGYPEYPEGVAQYGNNFFFKEGFVFAWTENLLSEEELQIFRRFTSVLSLTYRRYSELKEAEAQAREARIEAALERVRSRTMGMQRSDELAETVSVLFKQLLDLGVQSTQLRTCGIATFKENEPLGEIWITDITGEIISDSFDAPYDEAPAYKTIYSKWKSGEKFLELNLKGDEFLEHLSFVKKYSAVPNINLDEIKKFYKEIFFYVLYFSQGYLFIISYEALTEYHEIFKRFGALFHQTYTRFLDFIKVEAQNKIIQAENGRKTKELEDARQLQLAMLPKELPQLPHLDIAVYMKTATEVGGDYYDFNVDTDGTLTVLIGDATGHGMMSGMMVSIMKSFFISTKANIELKQFFENANNSIKDMHLGRLMMASMGVQITSEKVIATNAGMPSLLYFRNKSKKTGEFVSNNLPLGGMKGTKYLLKEIYYEKGDTLLLMSDGLAELKNQNNEQYGYERVKEEFRSVAQKSPNEIVEHLKDSAAQWIKRIEPDDDVTFVVIKVK